MASISYVDNGNGNITFINNSVAGSGASYGWILGDGNTSNLDNPTHTYTSSGTYFVEFAVMDTNCIDSAFLSVTVNINTTCTVVPMFNYVDNGNGTFTFTDASTTSSGGLMLRNMVFR
jgi:PKD repeat protein